MTKERISSENLHKIYESDDYINSYHKTAGKRIKRIVKFVPLNIKDKVIDLACGNGLLADVIHDKVKRYDGVDFSKKFIDQASNRASENGYTNVTFHHGDIIDFCEKNRGFDKAFALDFTEHLYDEDLLKIFKVVRKSLSKDGQLIIHTPNADFILEKLKEKGILKQVKGHIGVRNDKKYKRLFEKAGYTTIVFKYLPHYLLPLNLLHILSYIPFIGKFFVARLVIICKV